MAERSSHDLEYAHVPLSWISPVRTSDNVMNDEVKIPLATYETPLQPSCGRGTKISRMIEGDITYALVGEKMIRSVTFILDSVVDTVIVHDSILPRFNELRKIMESSLCFIKLIDIHFQTASCLFFVRSDFFFDNASGHNMTTLAFERLVSCLMEQVPELGYGSVSGDYYTDKKTSVINGILGRGKYVIAEAVILESVARERLRTTAKCLVELNERKNFVGSIVAGSLCSGSAHYANMLLGSYLATGQDATNIVEGSQELAQIEVLDNGSVRFGCTLPHLIVSSVGNGKGLDFAEKGLTALGCKEDRKPGENAHHLTACYAVVVWCGELSLFAAQADPGELVEAYVSTERAK